MNRPPISENILGMDGFYRLKDFIAYKNRSEKKTELILRCNNGGFPRYVVNQLKIFVPVGKDIKIVTPVK